MKNNKLNLKIGLSYMKQSIVLLLFGLSLNLTAQEKDVRFLSISYFQKICIKDLSSIGVNQNKLLPVLDDNARMHGMELHGAIMKNVCVGLSALGSLNDKKNEYGYTSWGGATGTFSVEYRFNKQDFFIGPSLGLGCGRFTYSAGFNDGTSSTTSHVDAFFTEPKIKVGYIVNNKFILDVEISRIINITSNEYFVGSDVSESVYPENFIIGLAVGYKFPFWNSKIE